MMIRRRRSSFSVFQLELWFQFNLLMRKHRSSSYQVYTENGNHMCLHKFDGSTIEALILRTTNSPGIQIPFFPSGTHIAILKDAALDISGAWAQACVRPE
jgi:hypothetical protein